VQGKEPTVYANETNCIVAIKNQGINIDTKVCIERYHNPRFTSPDEDGNVILDICFYVSTEKIVNKKKAVSLTKRTRQPFLLEYTNHQNM
jgi:hypothetical protein